MSLRERLQKIIWRLTPFFIFLIALGLILQPSKPLEAENLHGSAEFNIDPRLAPRVEFWKLIFSKYGKDQAVFHFRSHPHIIYSVLDFSEYSSHYSERELKQKKRSALKLETARIRTLLKKLAASGPGSDSNEQRIYKMFKDLGDVPKRLAKAVEGDQIRSQTGIRERFRDGLVRSGRYMYAIEQIFKEKGLPLQLARLPLIESSFDYTANSSVGAAGIWQFMRSTARSYMRVTSAVDERRDPIVASRAAARYLASAYKRLKTWPLAVTSYNHGVAGVGKAVRKAGTSDFPKLIERYRSRTFGFASSNFYPELLAAVEIERNIQTYFPGLKIEQPWYFDEVRLASTTSYKTVQQKLSIPVEEFQRFNPGLLRSVQQGRRSIPAGYLVRLPKGQGQQFASSLRSTKVVSLEEGTKLASSYKPAKGGSSNSFRKKYRVRRGDTIGSIARKFGVKKKSLMVLNGINNPRKLFAGRNIKIPGGSSGVRLAGVSRKNYVVRKGDTLGAIARRHKIKLGALQRLNPRVKRTIFPGQKLRVR